MFLTSCILLLKLLLFLCKSFIFFSVHLSIPYTGCVYLLCAFAGVFVLLVLSLISLCTFHSKFTSSGVHLGKKQKNNQVIHILFLKWKIQCHTKSVRFSSPNTQINPPLPSFCQSVSPVSVPVSFSQFTFLI